MFCYCSLVTPKTTFPCHHLVNFFDEGIAFVPTCIAILNVWRLICGPSKRISYLQALLSIDLVKIEEHQQNMYWAMAHAAGAASHNPPLPLAQFTFGRLLFSAAKFDAAKFYVHAALQRSKELNQRHFYQARQMEIGLLDWDKKHSEANALFLELLQQEKNNSYETIDFCSAFFYDTKRFKMIYDKLDAENRRLVKLRFDMESMGLAEVDDSMKDQLSPLHQLYWEKQTLVYCLPRKFKEIIDVCGQMLKLVEPQQEGFPYFVHRALCYHYLNQEDKAQQECVKAMQCSNRDVEQACTEYRTTMADVKYLKSTCLGPLFVHHSKHYKRNRLCVCCNSITGVHQRCSICNKAYYCNAKCQQKDWQRHQQECKANCK